MNEVNVVYHLCAVFSPLPDFYIHFIHYIHHIHYWLPEKRGVLVSEHSEYMDETEEYLFSTQIVRPSDNATITPLQNSVEVNAQPHSIGRSYVTEGFVLTAKVERPYYIRNGRRNTDGVGAEHIETKVEQVPLIIAAVGENGTPWLDWKPSIHAADGLELDGRAVQFAKFCEFQGCMDASTVTSILNEDYKDPDFNPQKPFRAVLNEIDRLIEMEACAARVMALWVAMSYVHDAFDAYPYLWFNGVKGSGKTRALELVEAIAYHAEMNMKISNPALFRLVDQNRVTICYDEAENLLVGGGTKSDDQDRVSLFNSGYRATGAVRLVEKDGDNFVIRRFRSYSPKALASIHPIDEALQSRCILLSMMTALDASKGNQRIAEKSCASIRRDLFKFRFSSGSFLKGESDDDERNEALRRKYDLKNREWELFKPLIIGAEIFCPDWLDEITEFIADQKIIRQVDNQMTREAIVLQGLISEAIDAENAPDDARTYVSYKDFLARLKEDVDVKLHPRGLGNCLRQLGLGGLVTRHGRGFMISLDRALFEKQARRLGMADAIAVPGPQAPLEKFSKDGGQQE